MMDDSELYDLTAEIKDLELLGGSLTAAEQIALLQVKAVTAHGYQMFRLGSLIEELIEPSSPRWQRIKGWLHASEWLS
jgi:hypothetical protein